MTNTALSQQKKYNDGTLEIYESLNVPSIAATSEADYNWLFSFDNELDDWGPQQNYLHFDNNRDYRRDNKR